MYFRSIQLQFILQKFSASFIPYFFRSRIVPAHVDELSSADIEALQVSECTQLDISPEEIKQLYNPAHEDISFYELDESEAFKAPGMEICKASLYGVFLRSTLFAGGLLDYQASRVYNAIRGTSSASVWFTRLVDTGLFSGILTLLLDIDKYTYLTLLFVNAHAQITDFK
jgi:hypothetical protein